MNKSIILIKLSLLLSLTIIHSVLATSPNDDVNSFNGKPGAHHYSYAIVNSLGVQPAIPTTTQQQLASTPLIPPPPPALYNLPSRQSGQMSSSYKEEEEDEWKPTRRDEEEDDDDYSTDEEEDDDDSTDEDDLLEQNPKRKAFHIQKGILEVLDKERRACRRNELIKKVDEKLSSTKWKSCPCRSGDDALSRLVEAKKIIRVKRGCYQIVNVEQRARKRTRLPPSLPVLATPPIKRKRIKEGQEGEPPRKRRRLSSTASGRPKPQQVSQKRQTPNVEPRKGGRGRRGMRRIRRR